MSIGLRTLDPQIAQPLRERARQLLSLSSVGTPGNARAVKALSGGRGVATARDQMMACLGMGGVCFLGGAALLEPAVGVLTGIAGFFFSLAVSRIFAAKGSLDSLDERIDADALAALAEHVYLEGADRAYLDAVARLAAAEGQMPGDSVRGILKELNDLVAQSRQLAAHREQLLAAMGGSGWASLEEQRAELRTRLEATSDAAARQAVEQSLELLDRRLVSARELRPSLERVEAQREVILQALATVQSSVARLQAAPQPLRAPSVEQIHACVAEVAGQTRAVEEAVQEVLALRVESGG